MQVATSYTTSRATHPATLKQCRALVFKFDTGHTLTRYEGGAEFYTRTNGRALNPASGRLIVEQMRAAIASR
jgi:ABC-type thiamine transport system substrate-binding protein